MTRRSWSLLALALLAPSPCAIARAATSRELLLAPPMVGRATAQGAEMNVLTGVAAVQVELWLGAEQNGSSELPVRFEKPQASDAPVAHLRARGALVPAGVTPTDTTLLLPANAVVELALAELPAGTAFRWRLVVSEGQAGERSGAAVRREMHGGRLVTARPRGSTYTFGVFSDSHIFPARLEPEMPPEIANDERILDYILDAIGWYRTTRENVAGECTSVLLQLGGESPDFAVSLGDVFDLHGRGFNWAFDTQELADAAHLEARRELGALAEGGALYQVLGNWEGESGCHPAANRAFAIHARERHAVNPRPDTSPLGGGADEDYFAWEWGDALCVALNVRGYTPTPHHLGNDGVAEGKPDDFTLGEAQKAFLEKTLSASDHRWKMLFCHHVVGGNGGNPDDSAYGRGGGRAAHVGEQAWVHELCRKHHVQVIFYGHDHVFTDATVDGVHYTLPGTTSAPWRFKTEETGYEKFWPDSGYARVRVSPDRLKVEFVALGGNILNAYEVAADGK
jgi:hypothetical protein